MPLRAILFDLGQTLLDYGPQSRWPEFRIRRMVELYPLACELWGELGMEAAEFGQVVGAGLQTDQFRAIEHSGLSLPFARRMREALAAIGVEPEDGALHRLVEAFNEPIRSWPQAYPDTKPSLHRLRALGVKLAVITNAPWDTPGRMLYSDLEGSRLAHLFETFVASGDVPWRKPNPEFMWAAARSLACPPERCLVVGDNLMADIGGARAAGMRSVWMNRSGGVAPRGSPAPDWVARSLEEVVRIVAEG